MQPLDDGGPDVALVVRARSEPRGVVVDWEQRVGGEQLSDLGRTVLAFLDSVQPQAPHLRAPTEFPADHPHRDEFPKIPPIADEYRFLEMVLTVGDQTQTLREPSAAERAQGAIVQVGPAPEMTGLLRPFVVNRFQFGPFSASPEFGKGPLVTLAAIVDAVRDEVGRRTG